MGRKFCDKTHQYKSGGSSDNDTFGPIPPQKVDSHNVEFGYELISALPYAYWLHQKGLLTGTRSGVDTECLYYFSPEHKINPGPRNWNNMPLAKRLPNIRIHRSMLDPRFSPPPLKEQYRNDRFVFDKPIVCICNRVNKEWNKEAINFFNIECLEKLFNLLKDRYHIVYFNIRGDKRYYDGPQPIDIGDYELAERMGVTNIHKLADDNLDLSFNQLQLMVMANSEAFITMNGGYSIMASYMGGTNIIYSKECQELNPEVNSFYRWYNRFGGSRIVHVDEYEDLYERVETLFTKKVPTLNVVMRSCERPNYFANAYRSVIKQKWPNMHLIVGYHDNATEKYLTPYKIYPVRYDTFSGLIEKKGDDETYGRPFPSNHYFNHLFPHLQDGYTMCLDDDDGFVSSTSAQEIMGKISGEDDLILWRTQIGDRIVPNDDNFGKEPVLLDISGIAFCCHSKHLKNYVSEPYKRWDYRLIADLYKKLNPIWIDKVLTKIQGKHAGQGMRLDKAQ